MKFRKMEEMSDAEVQLCMSIIIEDSIILEIRRISESNYIEVDYEVIGDNRRDIYTIALLGDSIEDVEYLDQLRPDAEYLYRQYLVAHGDSDLWKGNMFVVI